MANCLFIIGCRDMDRSAPSPFSDAALYPAANHRSTLTEEMVVGFYEEYHIPRTLWFIHLATRKDRIWHNPKVLEMHGKTATGLSEAALKCGFRVPTLQLLKHLFKDMGIALGQLDPNSFIHINVFQARCMAANVDPRTSLFWHHYDFRRNGKSKGFYTIARKTNRVAWASTNSNNKESHTRWFFFSGPKIAQFAVWKDVEPKDIVMPSFPGADAEDYRKLCELDMGKVPLSLSRDKDWLFALWGNGGNCSFITLHFSFSCFAFGI